MRRAVAVVQARDVATLLVHADEDVGAGGPQRVGQAADLIGVHDVATEEADAAEATVEPPGDPGGRGRGATDRRDEHGVRPPVELVAHPLTAPAVSPVAIRPCRMRKNTTTGSAVRHEAAMSGPHSVPFCVVNAASHTVMVCFSGEESMT